MSRVAGPATTGDVGGGGDVAESSGEPRPVRRHWRYSPTEGAPGRWVRRAPGLRQVRRWRVVELAAGKAAI